MKENNCECVVCQVERNLLGSLSTQTARIHFQALARKYPVLRHFDSPADVIAQLHQQEQRESRNPDAWNGILHALINAMADRMTEDIGQRLLLVAYTPAIHKVYWEVCQRFPELAPEDIAQQAWVFFLENAKSPAVTRRNDHFAVALVKYFRRRLFRWAIHEARHSLPRREMTADIPEKPTSRLEHRITLEKLLEQAKRDGLLSEAECELLLKFKREGFGAKELASETGSKTPNAMHHRLNGVNRLEQGKFATDLAQLSDKEIALLRAIAASEDDEFNPAPFVHKFHPQYFRRLGDKGLLIRAGRGRYQLYHPLFRQFLQQQP